MDVGSMLRLGIIDFLILVACALLIGFIAPRCPDRWFARDVGPLKLTRWDRVQAYRRIGIPWFAKWLPEGGSWMGGDVGLDGGASSLLVGGISGGGGM